MLDLMLGGSPFVTSLGEVHRLNSDAILNTAPCTCGQPILSCPFWNEVEEHVIANQSGSVTGRPLENMDMMIRKDDCRGLCNALERIVLLLGSQWIYEQWHRLLAPAGHKQALVNSFIWYDAVRETSGRPVVVDSSKDARRLGLLYRHAQMTGADIRLVFLVRDGRGVAASAMRREGIPMATAAKQWAQVVRKTQLTLKSIGTDNYLTVKYEDLCTDTQNELERICAHLGIPYNPQMQVLDKSNAHIIGGNPMRFRKAETVIKRDEGWRKHLSANELREFKDIAGTEATLLGYTV